FVKLLQSPLMAELVAVAATAALAALAEQGFTSSSGSRGKRAGNAVKAAGKAAAAAVGRRHGTELDEIRAAAKAKAGAKAQGARGQRSWSHRSRNYPDRLSRRGWSRRSSSRPVPAIQHLRWLCGRQ